MQSIKRTHTDDTEEEAKKARLGSILIQPDTTEFEFNELNMETSSQIGDIFDTDAANRSVIKKSEKDDALQLSGDDTVDQIVERECNSEFVRMNVIDGDSTLLELDDILPVDQDHNYIRNDNNGNDGGEEIDAISLKKKLEKVEQELELSRQENKALRETIINKNETIKVLDEAKTLLEDNKDKYEAKLSKYRTSVMSLDHQVKELKKQKSDTDKQSNTDGNLKKELKSAQSLLKKKETAEKELQLALNEKSSRISELESEKSHLNIMLAHFRDIDKSKQAVKKNDASPPSGTSSPPITSDKTSGGSQSRNKKCSFENSGTCAKKETCPYYHPKRVCQNFSKLGSCSNEASEGTTCDLRHLRKICFRLEASGYCNSGDRCRYRHPLNYAHSSIWRYRNLHSKNYFLGQNSPAFQGPGMGDSEKPMSSPHQKSPQEPWTPPLTQPPHQGYHQKPQAVSQRYQQQPHTVSQGYQQQPHTVSQGYQQQPHTVIQGYQQQPVTVSQGYQQRPLAVSQGCQQQEHQAVGPEYQTLRQSSNQIYQQLPRQEENIVRCPGPVWTGQRTW